MAEEQMIRLSQAARKLNVGLATISDTLSSKGFEIDSKPNSKITLEQFNMLAQEFASSAMDKEEASGLKIGKHNQSVVIDDRADERPEKKEEEEEEIFIKNLGSDVVQSPKEEPKEASPKIEEPKPETEKPTVEAKEEEKKEEVVETSHKLKGIKVIGKIDLNKNKKETQKEEKKEEVKEIPKEEEPVKQEEPKAEAKPKEAVEPEVKPELSKEKKEPEKTEPKEKQAPAEVPEKEKVIEAKAESLKGLTVLGKIELPKEKQKKKEIKPVASSDESKEKKKKKRPRKRITSRDSRQDTNRGRKDNRNQKEEISDKDIQDQIKATLAKLSGGKSAGGSRSKRRDKKARETEPNEQETTDQKLLRVTEFISANDLASLMNVSVNDIISACMGLGMFVSINQRLDAESITIIADEFGYDVDFSTEEEDVVVVEEEEIEENLKDRAPIVTIMGHVDHGKTSLLDFIRHSKVTEGEAGGITQHIGAYDVTTDSGKRIAFLDTPGHEAFTAMRARGAKITDIVIIVVAADDSVMPQTKEAINHAQVAGVPIIIAINKVDKPQSNPDKIREELSNINVLVEEWGGKYQSQEVSAKSGIGIDDLLDKVLLEAEMLELKANPQKPASGTVIEAELDKGRGYVTTVMVQSGKMKIGDVILAGHHYGKVKAMFDHRGKRLKEVGPSTPVQLLGLDGAPQAGDKLNVMENEREAREIATKREQLYREQSMRTKKHITLDEIGRRLAIGNFKELNVIVKGDVDGSVEAISDSLLKLSTNEIQVSIIHKGVGQISESDVLLASASDAVIVGFQVRPSGSARKLAETEEIEIRSYSIIYDVINDVKDAMEGMLTPTEEEVITGNIEVREVFKISKIGTVAGCYVTDGHIKRNNKIRLVRDGIVVYTGEINQLKRFKEDVNEVRSGYECGLSIKNFNDIKVGDIVEGFETKEVKRTL